MENDGTEHTDYGGVHYNSGIPNHAYYLLVQAIGRDHAEQIVYQTVTENLDSDANFEDFRTAMLQAARDLYGQDSTDFKGVNDAFAAVGLDGSWEAPDIEGC
jgi:bacillolysin